MIAIKVRGVIYDYEKSEIFLCTSDTFSSFLCLPGGTMMPGETREETLRREFKEELNIVPDIGELLYINEFTGPEKTTIDFWYAIKNIEKFSTVNVADIPGTELIYAGFCDPKECQQKYKPDDLDEILKKIL